MSFWRRRWVCWLIPLLVFAACHGETVEKAQRIRVPGYWFQFILIVIPLFILLIKGLMDLGEVKDNLVSLSSQCRRIISRLEELEDKVKALDKSKVHKAKEE